MIKKLVVGILSIGMMFSISPSSINAEEIDMTNEYIVETSSDKHTIISDIEELDQYITVRDNRYLLKLPDGIGITEEVRNYANTNLINTNSFIEQENKVINLLTKSVDEEMMLGLNRAYGVNGISFKWNYARIWLNRDATRLLIRATVGGILGFLGASTGGFTASVLGFSAPLLDHLISSSIIHGVRFDVDYFMAVLLNPVHNVVRQ